MHSAGLTAVAINADTLTSARKTKRSLYEDIEHGVSMVLLSPEQLKSSAFEKLVNKPSFKERLCMMAVDKAHLLNTWGQSFRKDFQQIGWVRARFQHSIPIAAVTATLQVGGPTDRVRKFLRFEDGRHHVIRRSNYCPDIKLIFHTMKNGLESSNFSDLDWIVDSRAGRRRTLIFLGTVAAGFCAQIYFWKKLADDPHRAKRVRMFNAVNHKHYNDETLTLWRKNDPDAQIIIATSILSVGIDAPTFDDVIIYGQPSDTDEFIQDYGRLRFMKSVSPHAFLYVTKSARTKAEQVLASKLPVGKEPLKQALHASRSPLELDSLQPSMAKLILSSCKVAQLDELYGNILDELPCSCLTCQAQPRPRRKEVCDCSGVSKHSDGYLPVQCRWQQGQHSLCACDQFVCHAA